MKTCPYCQSTERQVKAGLNDSGSQRYKCQQCQRHYTPQQKTHGYADALRQKAIQLYVDGVNFRRIGRIVGVSHQSVINWVNAHADQLPLASPQPTNAPEVVELDEWFTFVEKKKTSSTS